MKNPKLFIWTDFSPDYTPGLAFAIAKNETEAKKLVESGCGYEVTDWGKLEIRDANKKIARSVYGGS